MPIILAELGVELIVTRIVLDEKTKRHFESLGLIKGAKIVVLSNSNGDLIIKILDTKLALDKNTATKIFVA